MCTLLLKSKSGRRRWGWTEVVAEVCLPPLGTCAGECTQTCWSVLHTLAALCPNWRLSLGDVDKGQIWNKLQQKGDELVPEWPIKNVRSILLEKTAQKGAASGLIFSPLNQDGNNVWVLLLLGSSDSRESRGIGFSAHYPRLLLFHGDQCII